MTKEESYAERRQLFKNIWDTAMHIDEKDVEIMNKPKVIKTLRLDEVDRCVVGKKKKQRIKNLRTVCNKILDFCDRQDADDIFYEQMAAEGQEPPQHKIELLPKKTKTNKVKKKQVKKAKSLFTPVSELGQAKATTSERKDEFMRNAVTRTSRNTSPIKFKRNTIVRNSQITNKSIKSKASPRMIGVTTGSNNVGDTNATGHRRKIVKKKHSKRKKPSDAHAPPGILDWPDP